MIGNNPSKFSKATKVDIFKKKVGNLDTDGFPVDSVNWHDAIAFCNALSALENLEPYYRLGGEPPGGHGYRLLTEAEWEYVCRAGTVTPYHFDVSSTGTDRMSVPRCPTEAVLKRTERAGSDPPNQFGLFDLHGNVSEWCFDWHDKSAYASYRGKIAVDPPGPKSGTHRVLRGGSWTYPPAPHFFPARRVRTAMPTTGFAWPARRDRAHPPFPRHSFTLPPSPPPSRWTSCTKTTTSSRCRSRRGWHDGRSVRCRRHWLTPPNGTFKKLTTSRGTSFRRGPSAGPAGVGSRVIRPHQQSRRPVVGPVSRPDGRESLSAYRWRRP